MVDAIVGALCVIGGFASICWVVKLHALVGFALALVMLSQSEWTPRGLARAGLWYVASGLTLLVTLLPLTLHELRTGSGGLYHVYFRYDFYLESVSVLGVVFAGVRRWRRLSGR